MDTQAQLPSFGPPCIFCG